MIDIIPIGSETPTALVAYRVFRPNDHPFWSHYSVSLVHLRPLEGAPDAKLQFPGATHELVVYALDPSANHDLTSLSAMLRSRLEGPNLVEQFVAVSDEAAMDVLDRFMARVQSLDTDFRSHMQKVLRDAAGPSA